MVLNRDDATVMALAAAAADRAGRPRSSAAGARPRHASASTCRAAPGDWGLEAVNGMAWLVRALPAGRDCRQAAAGSGGGAKPVLICSA